MTMTGPNFLLNVGSKSRSKYLPRIVGVAVGGASTEVDVGASVLVSSGVDVALATVRVELAISVVLEGCTETMMA